MFCGQRQQFGEEALRHHPPKPISMHTMNHCVVCWSAVSPLGQLLRSLKASRF
jgi:hypothetical protein